MQPQASHYYFVSIGARREGDQQVPADSAIIAGTPLILRLKVRGLAPVMLMCKPSPQDDVCNGTRLAGTERKGSGWFMIGEASPDDCLQGGQ
jgi:hypothetical protein